MPDNPLAAVVGAIDSAYRCWPVAGLLRLLITSMLEKRRYRASTAGGGSEHSSAGGWR